MTFRATYDRTTKVISAVVILLLALVALTTQSLVLAGVYVLLILLAWAYSPTGYVVTDRSIVVRRPIGSVSVPLDDVRSVRAATSGDLRRSFRLWGSGGLFGYYGIFRTRHWANAPGM